MKVLVTGSAGFIGSHLTESLIESGYDVRAFYRYNSSDSHGWLDDIDDDLKKNIEFFPGDIRDKDRVETAVKGCDMIFHLAALIGIPYSYMTPEAYIKTNVLGTLNILQASLKHKIGKVLITSTSEVYGSAIEIPISESHPKQPQSPYSASKIGADALADSFFRSFQLPVTIVRPFNTYGPRQSARAVIPTIIKQILSNQNEIKLGLLSPKRDLVYVKDTAKGFIKLAECNISCGKEVNISTGSMISIGNLALKIKEILGSEIEIISDNQRIRPEKSEVMELLGDNSLLKELTLWVPKTDLDTGLKLTIEWIKNNMNYFKGNKYNV